MSGLAQRSASRARLQRVRLEFGLLLAGQPALSRSDRSRLLRDLENILLLESRMLEPDFSEPDHLRLIQSCHDWLNHVQHLHLRQHVLRLPSFLCPVKT